MWDEVLAAIQHDAEGGVKIQAGLSQFKNAMEKTS